MPGPIPGVAAHLKILIVTDAWTPQVNGVVRTLEVLGKDLAALGHTVRYATPRGPLHLRRCPPIREIRLALFPRAAAGTGDSRFRARRRAYRHRRHAGAERARRICLKHGIAFSTSFHTRFPEYVHARFPLVPEALVYRWLRWFHGPATAMMVATDKPEARNGGARLHAICASGRAAWMWITSIPCADAHLPYEGPIWLYVGRVAVEKNIEAFLALDLPGTKVVVGDGPARARLEAKYPEAKFLGALSGEARPGPMPAARLRLSQPHRHFRPGPAGGAGLRPAGGRLSGAGAAGRGGTACAGGGPGRGPARRPAWRRWSIARHPGPVTPRAFAEAPFLAGLHAAIPAQYHRRARRA